MMVANSFDLWQKDSFFSAAEEVQESADAYVSLFLVFFFFFWLLFVWVCNFSIFVSNSTICGFW
jgi:hypothetical protein